MDQLVHADSLETLDPTIWSAEQGKSRKSSTSALIQSDLNLDKVTVRIQAALGQIPLCPV